MILSPQRFALNIEAGKGWDDVLPSGRIRYFPRNTGTEFGLERQTLCRIYCAVLLSVLCYGSEKGWQSYHYHILTPQS